MNVVGVMTILGASVAVYAWKKQKIRPSTLLVNATLTEAHFSTENLYLYTSDAKYQDFLLASVI